jgi:hypothetical protein
MDDTTFQSDALPVLVDCAKLLHKASGLLKNTNAIVLIEDEGLYPNLLYAFNKLIRRLPPGNGIDVILHSLGGTTDAASAIASLCRVRFGSFRVIVPFMAKSAATLLALAADEILLATSAQLGPVDPQVRHPEKNAFFPAHSIREAMERVEGTKDPLVKLAMADKLDPFFIGAYDDAVKASKQYIEQVVENWKGVLDKQAIVSTFIDKYKSHGYPIDCKVLASIGVPHGCLDGDVEQVLGDLHEKCIDLLDSQRQEGAVILTQEEYLFRCGDFTQFGRFNQPAQMPLPGLKVPPPTPPPAAAQAQV